MNSNTHKAGEISSNNFAVVGIGASAGGLNAFKKFIEAIAPDSGMAFILLQHQDPQHKSRLPEILQKSTAIPIVEIPADFHIEPNHIYVIPGDKVMAAADGELQLIPRQAHKIEYHLPVDLLFTALAEVYQARAIGVVLSGALCDGTEGLKAIKFFGGITFAQDEESAEYDGMPSSAAHADVVDFILPPEAIPPKLLEVFIKIERNEMHLPDIELSQGGVFNQIFSLLQVKKGADFTNYKQTTVRRRIFRRMVLNNISELSEYFRLLEGNSQEQDRLFQDLLIPVTSFFRDKNSFELIRTQVFPRIITNKTPGSVCRVWVAGCSTGQEVYSIAICFKEYVKDRNIRLEIFGTDLSEQAIVKARSGIFKKGELNGISPQRLNTFFTKVSGGYQVISPVRDLCVFAHHNFLKDPPFGKMDFVSCRNVLIFMESSLQKKAIAMFHYALNPRGFLMLGKSETSGNAPGLFSPVEKTNKLYIRQNLSAEANHYTAPLNKKLTGNLLVPGNGNGTGAGVDFQKIADDILLRRFTPAGVVINDLFDTVHFRGSTSRFLEQLVTKPTLNLLLLAKPGLVFELRGMLHKAKTENRRVRKDNIPLVLEGQLHNIGIEIIPLGGAARPHFLVLFHDISFAGMKNAGMQALVNEKQISGDVENGDHLIQIQLLEKALEQAREDMRILTQEQESSNEELQSNNEELLSESEELQSLNEELKTSKEELQSTTEELTVLNQELIDVNSQLNIARDYAESIIATTSQPMLVLDKILRIKSANKAFYNMFLLHEADTEQSLIYELSNGHWNFTGFRTLLEKILPSNQDVVGFEVIHEFPLVGERALEFNAHEIIRDNKEERLILLSIIDITEQVNKRNMILHTYQTHSKQLEDKVLQRTSELSEANNLLHQKNEELQKTNKELESFTYVSSHDLQEPLRKIQTFVSIILQNEAPNLSNKGKDYFQRMQSATKRMQQLLLDLLNFSRVNSTEKVFEKIELKSIIDHLKDFFSEELLSKNATIETMGLCAINVIPYQFEQLFQNLISNSLKFAVSGTAPRISILCHIGMAEEMENKALIPAVKYCHIRFTDNGIGFDPKYREKIFEVFQRLHSIEEYAGTGIGLTIVKKIVENHNGFITATSAPGSGAQFDIYIPC